MKQGKSVTDAAVQGLIELIEAATTRYASIVEPESLALILARQARRAKAELPDKFGQAVQGLLDDFGKALGIAFEGPDGEEFFRSSLIQKFPAEVKPKQDLLSYSSQLERSANISDELWKAVSQVWKLKGDRRGAAAKTVTRKLFRISLAICHSPVYETEHKENLSQDWAHVPLPRDKDVFEEGVTLGEKLAVLLEPRRPPARSWARCSGSAADR
jgi:hypothetical protein